MKNNRQNKRTISYYFSCSRGFTIVELIVVMAIFIVVIIISSQAFNRILSISAQQTKSSESDTQGVVGLEMLRLDLEHAGYGLPWLLSFSANFNEGVGGVGSYAPGIDTGQFNDTNNATADTNKVPRAVQAAASTTDGRDYLVIKSILAGMSDTNKKWTFVEGVGASSLLKTWGTNNFVANERVITIDSRTKRLIGTSVAPADFAYTITAANMMPPAAFQPQQDTDVYVTYGISPATSAAALRAPYNRVDYYVKRPLDIPSRCAPGTGILYKGVMLHGAGGFTQYPLVDCVADMQVIFSLDTDGDGGVDLHLQEDGLLNLTAKEIRTQLKEIRVYIVAHEGGKDTNYNHSISNLYVGEFGNGRTLDLNTLVGPDYKYYRWKTYKLVVIPRNLNY